MLIIQKGKSDMQDKLERKLKKKKKKKEAKFKSNFCQVGIFYFALVGSFSNCPVLCSFFFKEEEQMPADQSRRCSCHLNRSRRLILTYMPIFTPTKRLSLIYAQLLWGEIIEVCFCQSTREKAKRGATRHVDTFL